MIFLVPTFSKATSNMVSLDILIDLTTVPSPKTLCLTLSPTLKSCAGAFEAEGEAVGRDKPPPKLEPPKPFLTGEGAL